MTPIMLTATEREVTILRGAGLQCKVIGRMLGMSTSTVYKHCRSALGVMGLRMPVGHRHISKPSVKP